MHAAALRIELRIPEARSLKAKRRVLQSATADLRNRMSVSVAEIDHHDVWQRSTVGVALVATNASELEQRIATVRRMLSERVDLEVIGIGVSHLEDRE
ncbi:MAG: DUF503 domain-containing protein [Acidimicrobiia bacterium]|nr:DUF503 domain-containing protein [Acidimicrobiia bacterium]